MSPRRTREYAVLPSPTAPMEARSAESLPDEPGKWQFEPKWDGFRCLAFKDGDAVELRGKSGTSLGRFFPEMVATLLDVPFERFIVDGELVIELNGRMTFDALQARLHPAASRIRRLSQETPARLILFDMLLGPDGSAVEALPLTQRRSALEAFGEKAAIAGKLIVTPCTRDLAEATEWLNDFSRDGRDGVVAKRLDGQYLAGERAMIKVKRLRTADCVVGGFRYQSHSDEVGSLLLGLYNTKGLLDHVGFTSTIANDERAALTGKLQRFAGSARFYRQGARRAQPLEHRAQRRMGAAQAGAGGRGPIRPRDERAVPPRDQAHALQARQGAAAVHDGSDPRAASGQRRMTRRWPWAGADGPAASRQRSGRSIGSIWIFLARALSLRKPPLTRVGFPWISLDSLSELRLIRGLRGKICGQFFLALSSDGKAAGTAAYGRGLRKGAIIHEPSLTRFLLFCNRLSSNALRPEHNP